MSKPIDIPGKKKRRSQDSTASTNSSNGVNNSGNSPSSGVFSMDPNGHVHATQSIHNASPQRLYDILRIDPSPRMQNYQERVHARGNTQPLAGTPPSAGYDSPPASLRVSPYPSANRGGHSSTYNTGQAVAAAQWSSGQSRSLASQPLNPFTVAGFPNLPASYPPQPAQLPLPEQQRLPPGQIGWQNPSGQLGSQHAQLPPQGGQPTPGPGQIHSSNTRSKTHSRSYDRQRR